MKTLALLVQMAAREGVILAFETMGTEFISTVAKARARVNAINSSYLQVYPDIGNITNAALMYETGILEDMEYGRGHLFAVHLYETRPGIFR